MIEALIDPWPPFTFCRPQAIVDQDAGVSIPNSSPFSRSTRFPFTSTPSPPAPLAIRKAPSASVESIEPRPPRPWPPFTFGSPQARSGRRSFDAQLNLPSPARRGFHSRPPPSPPAPLAIRKAPSASVESIEPRPPRPCEVGRPKGRRRKNRRQSHRFFFSTCCAWHPNSPPRPGGAPHPAPSARKSVIKLHRKLPSAPLRAPRRFGIRKSPATRGTAHSEVQ